MHTLVAELVQPFDRMPAATATALLREHWALEPTSIELLDTERDDSFHVTTPAGHYVLKVAHPSDSRELIEMQAAALRHAGARGVPVHRVVPASDGSLTVDASGRVARVLSWLPGELWWHAEPDEQLLPAAGRMLGRVSEALGGFVHPLARRTHAWDLQSFAQLRSAEHPPVAATVFERFAALDTSGLRRQYIHNDFHPGNVLVDDGRVVGVLDFGDSLEGWRIADVAVALAYLVPEEGDPWAAVEPFVAGFESVAPLKMIERDALPTLTAARLVQRIMLPPLLDPDDVDPDETARRTRTLENLLEH